MTTGESIVFVGTVFGLIYLYSITRDRWNWQKIILSLSIPFVLLVTFFAYLILRPKGYEDNPDRIPEYLAIAVGGFITIFLLRRITKDSWDWVRIFRYAKIASMTVIGFYGLYYAYLHFESWNTERVVRVHQEREERVRECNAKEIQRLEPLLIVAMQSVNPDWSLEQVKPVLQKIGTSEIKQLIPEKHIKQKQLKVEVHPKCDSDFRYEITVTADEDDRLLWYLTDGYSPPKGYRSPLAPETWLQYEKSGPPPDVAPVYLYDALRAADKAGNTEDAKRLADEIRGYQERIHIGSASINYEVARQAAKKASEDKLRAENAAKLAEEERRRKLLLVEQEEARQEKENEAKRQTELKKRRDAEEETKRVIAEKLSVMKQLDLTVSSECAFAKYGSDSNCGWINFYVNIKNNSNKKITGIAFGWDIAAKYPNECLGLGRYAPKETLSSYSIKGEGIMPGENRSFNISGEYVNFKARDLPYRICFDISNIGYAQ